MTEPMIDERYATHLRELIHQLRDALSPVTGAADLLRLKGYDAAVARDATQTIDRGVRSAYHTLEAYSLIDECERGTAELHPTTSDVYSLLHAVRRRVPETIPISWQLPDGPSAAIRV